MPRRKIEEEPETVETVETPEPIPAAKPLSIAAELAIKWGIPLMCLESVQYAVSQGGITWPGLAGVASDSPAAAYTAFDTLGQTLTRVVPFSEYTAAFIAGGDFAKWAENVGRGLFPDSKHIAYMIEFHKEG